MDPILLFIRFTLLVCLFLPLKIFATPVTFDLTNNNSALTSSSLQFSQDDVQLSLWSSQFFDGEISPAELYWDEFGVGVKANAKDNTELDNLGPDESLYLLFNQPVQLLSIGFTQIGSNDDFTLGLDDQLLVSSDIPGGDISGDEDTGFYVFSTNLAMGSLFQINPGGSYAEFSISRLDVEPASVPEPTSLLLLGLGICGIWMVQRARTTAPAENLAVS